MRINPVMFISTVAMFCVGIACSGEAPTPAELESQEKWLKVLEDVNAFIGEKPGARAEWDQAKAVAKVKGVIAIENAHTKPWDAIAWMTEAKEAAARAQKENKPIFLYFSVNNGNGPADAPC